MGPIYFKEIFKEKVWGGKNLSRLLDKKLPAGKKIGESWELSDFGEDCSIVGRGPLRGRSIRELLGEFSQEILGVAGVQEIGLLFKYLDAVGTLSVQVHPRKHESWYILEARPGARLYLGLKDGVGREEFQAAVAEGTVEQCLASVEPKAGQCYYLPSGLTHALGAGVVLAEIQTPEQITYRVYDWGRDRPIQVGLGLETINFHARAELTEPLPYEPGRVRLLQSREFSIDRCIWRSGQRIRPEPGEMEVWMILSGNAHYGEQGRDFQLSTGQTVLIPASCESEIRIDRQMCLLATRQGE